MRLVEGFKLREICGVAVVVPEGADLVNFNKMLSLNESATFLWKSVAGKDFDVDTLAGLLEGEYEIDHQTALADAQKLLDKWMEIGVVR